MTSPYDTYTSPLATRNASPAMLKLWSARHKFNTWRKIWLAVAEAQHEVTQGGLGGTGGTGVPPVSPGAGATSTGGTRVPPRRELVTKEQVEELRAVVNRPGGITDEEIRAAEKYERELRHDVMAHVHALGDACPKAKGIIHLGMTSQDVNDNAELDIIRSAIELIHRKLERAVVSLGVQAAVNARMPTLAFTHYQAAQPITVGRRIAQWSYDLNLVQNSFLDNSQSVRWWMRGLRGATGTQASYLSLFGGDESRVREFEYRFLCRFRLDSNGGAPQSSSELIRGARDRSRRSAMQRPAWGDRLHDRTDAEVLREELEWIIGGATFELVGQTYPRVIDTFILADLASVAAVLHKIATDIRLLCNRKEIDEPFEDKQIGSSAMPYKRNPMRCERICGLTRFVMNLVGNAYDTAATQWLERTLDDSSNRRLSLPEAFLALDGALDLMHNVASGLIVHEAMVRKNLMAELPFMATENILMACVRLGGDRQHYHELIRVHAQAAGLRVKQEGLDNDLLDRLKNDRAFWGKARGGPLSAELDWDGVMDPMKYVGRSVEQTERFIAQVIEPLREQYKDAIAGLEESGPRV